MDYIHMLGISTQKRIYIEQGSPQKAPVIISLSRVSNKDSVEMTSGHERGNDPLLAPHCIEKAPETVMSQRIAIHTVLVPFPVVY
jgi:hypothetical protein